MNHDWSLVHECCKVCGVDRAEYQVVGIDCIRNDIDNVHSFELARRQKMLRDLFELSKNSSYFRKSDDE